MKQYSFLLLEMKPQSLGSAIALANGGNEQKTLQALADMFKMAQRSGGSVKKSFEKGGDILNFARKAAANATAEKRQAATTAVKKTTGRLARKAARASQEARKVGEEFGSGALSRANGVFHSLDPLKQTISGMNELITSAKGDIGKYGQEFSGYVTKLKNLEKHFQELVGRGEISPKQMLDITNLTRIAGRQSAIINNPASTAQQREAAKAVLQKSIAKFRLSQANFDLGSARNFAVADLHDAGKTAAADFTRGMHAAQEKLSDSQMLVDGAAGAMEKAKAMQGNKPWYSFLKFW